MITTIEVFGYRCFPALSVDLDRFHVLAGANGSGKTTLLDITTVLGELLHYSRQWPQGQAKPHDPKEALQYLRRKQRADRSNAVFKRLARTVSIKHCEDEAHKLLVDTLHTWFPESAR